MKDTRIPRISKEYSNRYCINRFYTALRIKQALTYIARNSPRIIPPALVELLTYFHAAITEHQPGITFIRNVYDPFAESSHGERSIIKTCRMSRIVGGLVFRNTVRIILFEAYGRLF